MAIYSEDFEEPKKWAQLDLEEFLKKQRKENMDDDLFYDFEI